jgi:long-chain acyl-CoA synthetase
VSEIVLDRVADQLSTFPGYAQVRKVHCQLEPWSIENGLITPTLKLKRGEVCSYYSEAIEALYEDH